MAEKQESAKENSRTASADTGGRPSSGMNPVEAVFIGAAVVVAKLWHALTSDGVLAAAGRQGIDELGAALKAFPESIQVSETGTIWNPTPGEVAADRQQGRHTGSYASYSDGSGPPHPWPSEIANHNRHLPGKDHGNGHEHGHDAGHSM